MRIVRPLLIPSLVIALLGASAILAAEPKLAFDLVPDPRPSVTDIEEPEWQVTAGNSFLMYLRRALRGNAVSMAELIIHTKYYGDLTEKKYPVFPAAMHHPAYWRKWAARFTSEGWALLQEGHAQTSKYEAERCYIQAADAGNTEALFLASRDYGISSERRTKWFFQGAAQGNRLAVNNLAWAYWGENVFLGETLVSKDIATSWEYRKKAAAVGDFESLAYLGQRYAWGDFGFPKDETTAYIYYLLAAHFAKTVDDRMYVNHYGAGLDKLPEKLAPEQVKLAKETAAAWIAEYEAPYAKALEEARKRRAVVLEELRQELAPVVQWFAEQDAAAQKSRQ
ncbi:MAG: hypothetical protein LBM00_00285 [Deltaproteobacteria bacterium]|jgi:hypothetical protein|nr:hypothetical protein [Deltaproteobacteria bacterium]